MPVLPRGDRRPRALPSSPEASAAAAARRGGGSRKSGRVGERGGGSSSERRGQRRRCRGRRGVPPGRWVMEFFSFVKETERKQREQTTSTSTSKHFVDCSLQHRSFSLLFSGHSLPLLILLVCLEEGDKCYSAQLASLERKRSPSQSEKARKEELSSGQKNKIDGAAFGKRQ